MTFHRIARILLALPLAACAVDEAADDPADLGTTTDEIKNGSNWDPWTQGSETWTRNVVRVSSPVGGCTGTLLDYEWVVTAGHCFGATQLDPSTIQISHLLADGTTELAVGAEYMTSPDVASGVDISLVRVATPLHPGVATLPLHAGATSSVVGQTVFCAGYGAIAAGPSCSQANPSCPSGQSCDTGWSQCFTWDTGLPLKTAKFQIIADNVDADTWYQFSVPNAAGQIELPGDSGSSCWSDQDGGLTGINKAGNSSNYDRQTSIAAARDWIDSLVTPTVLATEERTAARCHAVSGTLAVTADAQLTGGASGGTALCPVDRPIAPVAANEISVPAIWVVDQNPTEDVCCHLQFLNSSGVVTPGQDVCSTGASSGVQALALSSLVEPYTFSSFSIACSVPPAYAGAQSRIETYRTTARQR